MTTNFRLSLFITATLILSCYGDLIGSILEGFDTHHESGHPKIWAVLVAGSYGWYNYRHQADVCRAYKLLTGRGVNPANIITMMYDDIANNKENPYPGEIFNEPNGTDVYQGVPIDYKGHDVTVGNFIAVLTGNKSAVSGGNGRVLESSGNDVVFINFVDHGSGNLISFPNSYMHSNQLLATLMDMHDNDMYKYTVIYLEACESGSMFENILPANLNVYAVTAANFYESSWACYCNVERDLPCLGDYFSVLWMEDSEQEDLTIETLHQQYEIIKKELKTSHASKYGDMHFVEDKVAEFQGWTNFNRSMTKDRKRSMGKVIPSRDIYMHELLRQINRAQSEEKKQSLMGVLADGLQKREYLNHFMRDLVESVAANGNGFHDLHTKNSRPVEDTNCHHTLIDYFHTSCFNLGKNPYAMQHMHVFKNMCNARVPVDSIIETMARKCSTIEMPTDIH